MVARRSNPKVIKMYGSKELQSRCVLDPVGFLIWARREEFTNGERNPFSNSSWSDFNKPYLLYNLSSWAWRSFGGTAVDNPQPSNDNPAYGVLVDAGVVGGVQLHKYYVCDSAPSAKVYRSEDNGKTWALTSSAYSGAATNWRAFIDTPVTHVSEQLVLPIRYLSGVDNMDRQIYAPTPTPILDREESPSGFVPGDVATEFSHVYITGESGAAYGYGYEFDHVEDYGFGYSYNVWVPFHARLQVTLSGISIVGQKVYNDQWNGQNTNIGYRGVVRVGANESFACKKLAYSTGSFKYRLVFSSNGGATWEDRGAYPGTLDSSGSDNNPDWRSNWNDHGVWVWTQQFMGYADVKWVALDTVATVCGGLVIFESMEFYSPAFYSQAPVYDRYRILYAPDRYDPFTYQVIAPSPSLLPPRPLFGQAGWRKFARFTEPNKMMYVVKSGSVTELSNTTPELHTTIATTTNQGEVVITEEGMQGFEITNIVSMTLLPQTLPPEAPPAVFPTWSYVDETAVNKCTWEVKCITLPQDNKLPPIQPPYLPALYEIEINFMGAAGTCWAVHEVEFTSSGYTDTVVGYMDESGRRKDQSPFFFVQSPQELGGNTWSVTANSAPPLAIGVAPLPEGYLDSPDYAFAFSFVGGRDPVKFRLAEGSAPLPPGMVLDGYGFLHGPLDVDSIELTIGANPYQDFPITIEAYDSFAPIPQVSATSCTIRINSHGVAGSGFVIFAPAVVVIVLSTPLKPFELQFTATGGVEPYAWSGAYNYPIDNYGSIDPVTGLLSGAIPQSFSSHITPGNARWLPITVRASAVNGDAMKATSLGVVGTLQFSSSEYVKTVRLVHYPTMPPRDEVTVEIDFDGLDGSPTRQGGLGAATISLAGGSLLPPGLYMSGNTIRGTATAAGSYTFTLHITDNAETYTTLGIPGQQQTGSLAVTLVVEPSV